jgi:hypothetical protein
MKSVLSIITLAIICCGVTGEIFAKVGCDEVKAKIEAKLATNGVKKYTLEVVPKDQATDLRVVGTCEGGAKKITYKRD